MSTEAELAERTQRVLCGLRDCATRYAFQPSRGKVLQDLRPLEHAFFRAERLDTALLAQLAGYLGITYAPVPEQVTAVLKVQEDCPDLLDLLRGPKLTTALEEAERVVKAWVLPVREVCKSQADWNQAFLGATFLLRCIAPPRFPIVARPADLLESKTRKWTGISKFLEDYRKHVRAVLRVARKAGLLDPMRLHDGMQQMSRCLKAGTCNAAGNPACKGLELARNLGSRPATRKDLLWYLRVLLLRHATFGRAYDLRTWLDDMLPSEHTLVDGLRVLPNLQDGKPENLLAGLEEALRVRVVAAGEVVARERMPLEASGRRVPQYDGGDDPDDTAGLGVKRAAGDSDADDGARGARGHGLTARDGYRRITSSGNRREREREDKRRLDEEHGGRMEPGERPGRPVVVQKVADAICTPKSLVDRLMSLTDEDAVAAARKKRKRRPSR